MDIPDRANVVERKELNGITHMLFYELDGEYQIWYGFSDKQLEVRDAYINGDNDIVEIQADTRSGKSVLASRLIISLAWTHSDTEWGVIGDGYNDADRSTFKVLREQIPNCEQDKIEESEIVEKHNKTKNRIKLKNGSWIYMSSSENPTGLKGSGLNGIWADETYFYKDVYKTLRVGFQRMGQEPRYGTISTTSLEAPNDHHDIFQKGINPKNGEDIEWNIEVFTMDIHDNPFLTDEIKEGLERSGNLGSDYFVAEGRVYESFKRSNHVVDISDYQIDDNFRLYGMDFGWDDPTVVLEIGRTNTGQYVVLDEYYKSKTQLEDAMDWIEKKPAGTIYADWNPRQIERLRREITSGHRFESAYKDIDDGINQVRKRLQTDSTGSHGLLFSSQLSETITEIMGYTQEEVGSAQAKDHAMDSLRYAISSPQRDMSDSNNGGVGGFYYTPTSNDNPYEEDADIGITTPEDHVGED
jgi:hypothetical protein